jgi:hypothetical protein
MTVTWEHTSVPYRPPSHKSIWGVVAIHDFVEYYRFGMLFSDVKEHFEPVRGIDVICVKHSDPPPTCGANGIVAA